MTAEEALKSGALTRLLNSYSRGFTEGFSNLLPDVEHLAGTMLAISIALYGIAYMLGAERLASLGGLIIGAGIWLNLVRRYDYYSKTFIDSLIKAGLIAGGEPEVDPKILLDPSTILERGMTATEALREKVGGVWFFNVDQILSVKFAHWMMIAAYAVIALHAMATNIEYVVGLSGGAVCMPFGLLRATRWVAMKPLSYMLGLGLRHMVLALIWAKSAPILTDVIIDPNEEKGLALIAAEYMSIVICYFAWVIPTRVSQGIMSGSAAMHGGQLAGAAIGAAAAAKNVVTSQVRTIATLASPQTAVAANQAGQVIGQRVAANSSFVGGSRVGVASGQSKAAGTAAGGGGRAKSHGATGAKFDPKQGES